MLLKTGDDWMHWNTSVVSQIRRVEKRVDLSLICSQQQQQQQLLLLLLLLRAVVVVVVVVEVATLSLDLAKKFLPTSSIIKSTPHRGPKTLPYYSLNNSVKMNRF